MEKKGHAGVRTSLFKRMTLRIIGLFVVVFVVTGVIIGYFSYSSNTNLTHFNLTQCSSAYSQVIDKDIQILKEQLNTIAQYAVGFNQPLNSPKVTEALDKKKSEYGFNHIYGIDSRGYTSTKGLNISERDYFIVAIGGEFFVSDPFEDTDGVMGITVAAPAYRDNSIVGIISCRLPYNYFSNFLNYKIGDTGNSYILNKNGTVVAHTDNNYVSSAYNMVETDKAVAGMQSQIDTISKMLSGNRDILEYRTNAGLWRVGVANPILATDGWILVTAMDKSEITGAVISILVALGVVVILGILACISIIVPLARSIARPVVELSERMVLLSNGDLKSPVPVVKTGDESELLANAVKYTVEHISGYIKQISEVTAHMSEYDLDVEVVGEFKGDFEPIKTSLNRIINVLNTAFRDINSAAQQVNNGSGQISSAAQSLSEGATEQAASVEELSSTIHEISNQIAKNAENAVQAKDMSSKSSCLVEENNVKMQQMMDAMSDINRKSDEIHKIIKTIEDIAFQTNILALNAAVEAARAGAAGKGFAVVADEVRNLASKSAKAAKDTTVLIEQSVKAVDNGSGIARDAAEAMNGVVTGVQKVTLLVDQIAEESNAQAISIAQVSQGIGEISAVVQTNSATSEETAASSEEFSTQAQLLESLVGNFQLKK